MQASPETIYPAIYVQARDELRREVVRALRTGRAMRRLQRRDDARRTRYAETGLMISHRPAEAADGPCQATGKVTSSSVRGTPLRSARALVDP